MGIDNRRIHEAFQNDVPLIVNTGSAREAVKSSFQLAEKGRRCFAEPGVCKF